MHWNTPNAICLGPALSASVHASAPAPPFSKVPVLKSNLNRATTLHPRSQTYSELCFAENVTPCGCDFSCRPCGCGLKNCLRSTLSVAFAWMMTSSAKEMSTYAPEGCGREKTRKDADASSVPAPTSVLGVLRFLVHYLTFQLSILFFPLFFLWFTNFTELAVRFDRDRGSGTAHVVGHKHIPSENARVYGNGGKHRIRKSML